MSSQSCTSGLRGGFIGPVSCCRSYRLGWSRWACRGISTLLVVFIHWWHPIPQWVNDWIYFAFGEFGLQRDWGDQLGELDGLSRFNQCDIVTRKWILIVMLDFSCGSHRFQAYVTPSSLSFKCAPTTSWKSVRSIFSYRMHVAAVNADDWVAANVYESESGLIFSRRKLSSSRLQTKILSCPFQSK